MVFAESTAEALHNPLIQGGKPYRNGYLQALESAGTLARPPGGVNALVDMVLKHCQRCSDEVLTPQVKSQKLKDSSVLARGP